MDVLIVLIVVIMSQCMCISNHQVVHFTYLIVLFVIYTLIKVDGKKVSHEMLISLKVKVTILYGL